MCLTVVLQAFLAKDDVTEMLQELDTWVASHEDFEKKLETHSPVFEELGGRGQALVGAGHFAAEAIGARCDKVV